MEECDVLLKDYSSLPRRQRSWHDKMFVFTERKGQGLQEPDNQILGCNAAVSTTGNYSTKQSVLFSFFFKWSSYLNQLCVSWPDFIPAYKILGGVPAWGKGNSLTKWEIYYSCFFLFKPPNAFFNTFASLAGAERTSLQQARNFHPFFFSL